MKSPALILSFLLPLCVNAAEPFTLEQVLAAPFASNLTAAPRGDAVAWVVNSRGVRNIWIAAAPAFTGRAVTAFTADDGQDLDDLVWNGAGSAVLFTRGGSPNGRGEIPNPRNDPAGARQEVWIAPVTGGVARRLGSGHGAAVTVDGKTVAWVSGGQIWSVAVAGNAVPEQLIHARGAARDLSWSPDGKQLLFVSSRNDHSFIGVYDSAARTVRYVDPTVDQDRYPTWSADGSRIAFTRVPASVDENAYGGHRAAEPWSIRVADAKTGRSKEVWHAKPGTGSVYWPVSARSQLQWGSGGSIIFPWEGDGWLHLYAVADGEAHLLTPGAFEVDSYSVSDDGAILLSSNQEDGDRRHAWRIAAGGSAERVTTGTGMEWAPASLTGGRVATLRSDAKVPAHMSLVEPDQKVRDIGPVASGAFPSEAMVEPEPVMITAADRMSIHGQLFLPKGEGKHPAVVFFHGGSRRQMLLGWNPSSYYSRAYGFNQYLASLGYVVLSVNYRSGTGYGMEFRQALKFGPLGASDFNDVLGAGRYLRSRSDVDPARIGVWGGSYGGYLAAMGLDRASNLFAAGVDLHGIHDWNLEFPEWNPDVQRVAYSSSPLSTMGTWKSPVLVIQGDDDRNVAFANSVQLIEALRKQGVPHEQIIFPDEAHEFLLHENWLTAFRAAETFLGKYLKP